MSCGKFFTVCSIGLISVFGILYVLVLALIDLPTLIVSAVVKNRILILHDTPLPKSNNVQVLAITLIVLSSLTIVFSCCGGRKNWQNSSENKRKRSVGNVLCSLMIGLFMLAQICIGIYMLATEKSLANNVRATTVDIFANYNDTTFEIIQARFQCCGLDGSGYWSGKLESLPTSCCDPAVQSPCSVNVAYAEGCLQKTVDFFVEQSSLIGWIIIGFEIGKCVLVLLLLIGIPCCAAAVASNLEQTNVVEYDRNVANDSV